MFLQVFDAQFVTWIVLPVLIFVARVADVSLGTIRVIFISKGFKYIAPLIGFFEILIWLFAIGQITQNLENLPAILAYAAGFSFGTFVGMFIEEKISLGDVLIRIITKHNVEQMIKTLEDSGYKITSVNAEGMKGAVKIIMVVAHRKSVENIIGAVHNISPDAFYTIEEIRSVGEENLQVKKHGFSFEQLKMLSFFKKGK